MGGPLGALIGANFISNDVFSLTGEPLVPTDIFTNEPTFATPIGGVAAKMLPEGDIEVFVLVSNSQFTDPQGGAPTPQNRLYRGVVQPDGTVVEEPTLIQTFTNNFEKPQFTGFATLGGDFYATAIELEANNINTDFTTLNKVDPVTGDIERIASFGGFIEFGLGGSDSRGRLVLLVSSFIDDFESPSNFLLGDVALLEFDPRTGMITDAVWGGNGGFEVASGGFVDPMIDLEFLRDADSNGSDMNAGLGLAVQGNGVTFIADVDAIDSTRVQALFSVDFTPGGALGPNDPHLLNIDVVEQGTSSSIFLDIPIGLSAVNPGAATGPRGPMSDPGPMGIDRTTIDPLFADVSYTQRALDSGAVEALFLDAFLRSAQDPMGCVNSNLISMVGPTLQNRVEQTSGIGRASYDLRVGLSPGDPCSSVVGPPGVAQ